MKERKEREREINLQKKSFEPQASISFQHKSYFMKKIHAFSITVLQVMQSLPLL